MSKSLDNLIYDMFVEADEPIHLEDVYDAFRSPGNREVIDAVTDLMRKNILMWVYPSDAPTSDDILMVKLNQ